MISLVIPVYNENASLEELLRRVVAVDMSKELIVVDDCSTDGSREILARLAERGLAGSAGRPSREREPAGGALPGAEPGQGRGAPPRASRRPPATWSSCRTRTSNTTRARFPGWSGPSSTGTPTWSSAAASSARPRRVLYYWHAVVNWGLTTLSNMTSGLNLTDMETCYKAFRRELIQSIRIEEDRFGFEPEITAKVARAGGPGLRGAHQLPRPHLRGREEDRLEGRRSARSTRSPSTR